MASAVTTAVLESVPHHLHEAMLDFVYTAMDTLRGILIPGFVDSDGSQAKGAGIAPRPASGGWSTRNSASGWPPRRAEGIGKWGLR